LTSNGFPPTDKSKPSATTFAVSLAPFFTEEASSVGRRTATSPSVVLTSAFVKDVWPVIGANELIVPSRPLSSEMFPLRTRRGRAEVGNAVAACFAGFDVRTRPGATEVEGTVDCAKAVAEKTSAAAIERKCIEELRSEGCIRCSQGVWPFCKALKQKNDGITFRISLTI
jgi:hypothetical protein